MTASKNDSPICIVCHKQVAAGEEYLVRMHHGRPTTVHRHLCFPPAGRPQGARPLARGAA